MQPCVNIINVRNVLSAGPSGHPHGAHDGGRVHGAAAGPHGRCGPRARQGRPRAAALVRAAAAHAQEVLHLPLAHG